MPIKTLARKHKLTPDEVFFGLLDHGLFGEKVPPCFRSNGLAAIAKTKYLKILKTVDKDRLKKQLNKHIHDYIRYQAMRDVNIPRHFGIPHPESYAIQSLAIRAHWTKIANHCDRSSGITSRIYIRPVGGGRIFGMNYKGIERFQLEEAENLWLSGARFIVDADISACFPSIYTHSIPWALHTHSIAKSKRGLLDLPGNLLDQCTQCTRDGQTNGVLIGPHASNLIAEIILTSVDQIMMKKGFKKLKRYIDDYQYFAKSFDDAEKFIRVLGMALRKYELTLNEKKTEILPLPRPREEHWVRELQKFAFPKGEELRFSNILAFLDLAIELSSKTGTSTPINYAIKMIKMPLNPRAKRLYVQEAINLALNFPYLAPYLDETVFDHYSFIGIENKIAEFARRLVKLGIDKLYPDAIAWGIYYALKHSVSLKLRKSNMEQIIALDDCIATVLLLEYAKRNKDLKGQRLVNKRSDELIGKEMRELDKQWLLIFQAWTIKTLRDNNQMFLASLKESGFSFTHLPPLIKKTAAISKAAYGTTV